MRLIRFREKHDDRVFVYSTGLEKQLILAQVAQERLQDGTWYDDENGSDQIDLLKPMAHLSDAERIGQLLPRWQHRPRLWLLHYQDTRDPGYDHAAITESRIKMCPEWVQTMIGE